MKQHPGSGLTVPQLVYALELKLRQTVAQEGYVSGFFIYLDGHTDGTSARPIPLIQLEDVRQRLFVRHTKLTFPIGLRTRVGSPLDSPGRQVVGEHVQSCEPSPSRGFVLDSDISAPQT